MWQELLDLPGVGIRDDFLELGGHSLIAATMIGKIEEQFGVEVSAECLFDEGTIEALSRAVEAALAEPTPIDPLG
jgi:syringomycin synthetase protein SyrE